MPDPKKGFERWANCNAIKNGNVNLNKLEQSMPNDADIRAFANYCDRTYRINPEDKVKLLEYVFKPLSKKIQAAAKEVKSDLLERL